MGSAYQNEGNVETFIVKTTVIEEGHLFQPDGTFTGDTPNAIIVPTTGPAASIPVFVATASEGASNAVGDPVSGVNLNAYTSYNLIAGDTIAAGGGIVKYSDTVAGCVDTTSANAVFGYARNVGEKTIAQNVTVWPLQQ